MWFTQAHNLGVAAEENMETVLRLVVQTLDARPAGIESWKESKLQDWESIREIIKSPVWATILREEIPATDFPDYWREHLGELRSQYTFRLALKAILATQTAVHTPFSTLSCKR